jgi:hypothetical protein
MTVYCIAPCKAMVMAALLHVGVPASQIQIPSAPFPPPITKKAAPARGQPLERESTHQLLVTMARRLGQLERIQKTILRGDETGGIYR